MISKSAAVSQPRPAAAEAAFAPGVRRTVSRRASAPRAAAPGAAGPARGRPRSVRCRADVNWDAFRGESSRPAPAPSPAPSVKQFDYLVIGSGIAGLTYALKVAQYGTVAVVTKDVAHEGSTQYAQGGVCAVLDPNDSVQDHVRDTIVAGAYLCDPQAVEVVCREGPPRVLDLVRLGADFTRNRDGSLHLTREGGHSNRRIVHAADATGAEIQRALTAAARRHANIHFFEHHLVTDLVVDEYGGMLHCFGADVLDQRSMTMCRFLGLATMLASGGAGHMYPSTTNPSVSTGDGVAMAYRAHAAISNMEFVQFHPTALYTPPGGAAAAGGGARTALITEAVRGEGGRLLNLSGDRFMSAYDDRLELAPRDVVARAIQDQMLRRGEPHVWLDISHKPPGETLSHFPNVAARCAEQGIDITRDPIPVLPAQHYMCGGVATGLLGETSVQGLYATGEVSCTGLHGANRLASNSLLEALVFADRAVNPSVAHAEHALRSCGRQLHYAAASADFSGARAPRQLTPALAGWVAAKRGELQRVMWEHCGIVRTSAGLQRALDCLAAMYVETKALYRSYGVSTPLVELYNLVTAAELTVSCALQRRESRGLHYTSDYPRPDERECRPSVIRTALKARVDLSPYKKAINSALPTGGLLLNSQQQQQYATAPAAGGAGMASAAGSAAASSSSSSPAPGGWGAAAQQGQQRERDLSVRANPSDN